VTAAVGQTGTNVHLYKASNLMLLLATTLLHFAGMRRGLSLHGSACGWHAELAMTDTGSRLSPHKTRPALTGQATSGLPCDSIYVCFKLHAHK
jgi:hypothetical protein